MKKLVQLLKYSLPAILTGLVFATVGAMAATTLFPFQGGTGTNQQPAKGTLLVGSTTAAYNILAVGSNGLCLIASSTAQTGLAWMSCAAASGSSNTTTTFNGQAPTITVTFATSGQANITIGSSSVAGSFTWTFSQPTSTASVNGYLSSGDWTTFNAKANAGAYTTTTLSAGNGITVTNGGVGATTVTNSQPHVTSTIITGGTTATGNAFTFATSGPAIVIACATSTCTFTLPTSTASQSGALSSGDWTIFNAKQNAITFPLGVASTSLSAGNGLTLNGNVISWGASPATSTITTVTSTLANLTNIIATSVTTTVINAQNATTTNEKVTNLTVGSLGGLLKATNGLVGTAASGDYVSSTGGLTGAITLTPSSTIGVNTNGQNISLGAKFYPIQWIIENPATNENDAIFTFRATSTINSCNAINKTPGDTVTFGLGYAASRATASSSLFQVVSGTTTVVTATTTPVSITLGSTTPNNLNPLIFYTTAASSSQFEMTCFYSEN